MNMSDDLASAAIQVTTQATQAGTQAIEKAADIIAKLFQFLEAMTKEKAVQKNTNKVKSTDLSDIKFGEVKYEDLKKNAIKLGDTISTSKNGFTKEDIALIKKKAKDYKIPVSFTNTKGKDNIYANVRSQDLQMFRNLCTDMMREKLVTKPQNLSNFKCNEWEIPFITNELNKYDLSATFGKTKSGEHFCLFDKESEKAVLIARAEFARNCNDINNDINFDRGEDGNYTLKDNRTGKEITFDTTSMSQKLLKDNIISELGYEENKSEILCAKFGEEMLNGEDKKKFFDESPTNEFSKIESNVQLDGESILSKNYNCWRLTPKSDKIAQIVFQDDNGNYAVLNPNKMSKRKMEGILSARLGIIDNETLSALINKAEKVNDYYIKQDSENFTQSKSFSKSDFDMSNPDIVSNMKRTDENGVTYTKFVPVSEINTDIERKDKMTFAVASTAISVEMNTNGGEFKSNDTQELVLSFSNKKNAIAELKEMYKKQGVPDNVANQMAKDVFHKAEAQSAEKIIQIEEILSDKHYSAESIEMNIKCGNRTDKVNLSDLEAAKEKIINDFGTDVTTAETTVERAKAKSTERQIKILENNFGFKDVDTWNVSQASDVISYLDKHNWELPDDFKASKYVPDDNIKFADKITDFKSELSNAPELSDLSDNVPEISHRRTK